MLLFKRKFLDPIRRGEKTQTLRNWKSQRLQSGQKDLIPGIGPIWIDSVEKVSLDDLTDEDAIPDGFPTIDALKAEIRSIYGDEPQGDFYRVRFHVLKADENEGGRTAPARRSRKEKAAADPPETTPENSPENPPENPPKPPRKKSVFSPKKAARPGRDPASIPEEILVPQSREFPAILQFARELKEEFEEKMKRYLNRIEIEEQEKMMEKESEILTEAQVVEKMVRRCRINRNVCDWNHEPGKSQDFFELFLRSPRDERGVPTLDGYRLRSLMRDFCTEEQWEEINWIASEICSAWTEWQYAVDHWTR